MENLNLYFNKVSEDEKEIAVNIIKRDVEKGAVKITDEYEKNEEEIKAIEVINNLLIEEFKKLDISMSKARIIPERVHMISREIADSLNIKGDGAYSSKEDAICIVKDINNNRRLRIYQTILHEMIHYFSFDSRIILGESKDIETYRSGFHVQNFVDSTSGHEHFRGFNEAVIEKFSSEIIRENRNFLIKEFQIEEEELKTENKHHQSYEDEVDIINFILERMSEFYKKNSVEIWKNFKKGLFSGDMMHLRKIEEVFGPGALRVLGSMTSKGSVKNLKEEKIFENLKKFFNETSQEKRNILAREILSERERLQYNNSL